VVGATRRRQARPGATTTGRNGNPAMIGRPAALRTHTVEVHVAPVRRILGIDPGTLRLGYGVIEAMAGAQLRYVECGVITAPAHLPRAVRLVEIARGLRELVAELRPDCAAMEEAFF